MTVVQSRQIPLDLGHRTAMGREDFLIAPCNRDAVGWVDRWPGWGSTSIVIHGPASSGKTHLAAVWKGISEALVLPAQVLAEQDANDIFMRAPHFSVDHLDPWVGDRTAETTLFHLYNLCRESGKSILMTMRSAPGQIDFSIPDLASRMRSLPAVPINLPDETLLSALLVKLFSDRQIQVGTDVIAYIVPRMERSFKAAHDLVTRADMLAMSEKKPVTVPLIRRILSDGL